METKLFEYGIRNEESDIRAHVAVLARIVYVFQTKNGIAAMNAKEHRKGIAWQSGIKTGVGHLVPPADIPDIRRIKLLEEWFSGFSLGLNESGKGSAAVLIVLRLLEEGRFPLWLSKQSESGDLEIQVRGTDISIKSKARIQVKCDYRGGEGEGCTGNLFLQIAERNPFKKH